MPGYVIHLAVGKVYEANNNIEDIESFEKGIIAPDLEKDKSKSHYGPDTSHPGLERFLQEKGISGSFNEGYFLHLLTDYLFYNKLLDKWETSIYDDYDKLNRSLIQKYGITIPEEIKEIVQFSEGPLSILDEEQICKFIDSTGRMNIRQMEKQKEPDFYH